MQLTVHMCVRRVAVERESVETTQTAGVDVQMDMFCNVFWTSFQI